MKSWISAARARRGNGRSLPRVPSALHGPAAHCFRPSVSGHRKAERPGLAGNSRCHLLRTNARINLPAGDTRRDTWDPIPTARVSSLCWPRRRRRRSAPSINSLHQLVPRAVESSPQTRSNRNRRLRTSSLKPLEVGAVDLREFTNLLGLFLSGDVVVHALVRLFPSRISRSKASERRTSAKRSELVIMCVYS